ncbi:hypothetical protein J2Z26_002128 [Bacillus luteolus]|nr:hypothetical protein [Cytobacillus luteolus]
MIAVQPNYIISQSVEKVVLRNFEGVITSYPEPQNYVVGRAEGYFKNVYPDYEKYKSNVGISAVMNDILCYVESLYLNAIIVNYFT